MILNFHWIFHWTNQCSGADDEPVTSHVHMALLLSVHLLSALMLYWPAELARHFSQLNSSLNLQKCNCLIFVCFCQRPQHTKLITTVNCLRYISLYQLDICIHFLNEFISFFCIADWNQSVSSADGVFLYSFSYIISL